MRLSTLIPVCALMAAAFFATPLSAQNAEAVCTNNGGGHAPEDRINACTLFIVSPYTPHAGVAVARMNRAMAYHESGRYVEAATDALEAAESGLLPPSPRGLAYAFLGLSRAARDNHAGAIEAYDQATAYAPDEAFFFLLRGQSYGELRDYARAIADADRAAQIAPDRSIYHNGRCWWRAVARVDLATARAACDRAIGNPDEGADVESRAGHLDSRGLLNLREDKWAEAWADYDAALRLNPDFAHALYGRGVAAIRAGRVDEGRADIQRALEIDDGIGDFYAGFGVSP